jgi:hypothetical protein
LKVTFENEAFWARILPVHPMARDVKMSEVYLIFKTLYERLNISVADQLKMVDIVV